MMRAWRWWIVAWLVMVGVSSTAAAQTLDPAREPSAQLRFVHGLLAGPAVDIYLDGQRIVSALPPGEATAYGLTPTGTRTIRVQAAGSDTTNTRVLEQSLTLGTGLSYTLAIAGKGGTVEAFVLEDDTGTSTTGQGSLRLVNLAATRATLAATVGEAALTGAVPYGAASERVPVDKSQSNPTVTVIDTGGQALLTTPALPLGGGEFYTLFVTEAATTLQPLLVSYPLTSGEPPAATVWMPLAVGGPAASTESAPAATSVPTQAQPAPTAVPAGVLPTAGGEQDSNSLWLMLMGGGFLLLVLAFLGRWGWTTMRR